MEGITVIHFIHYLMLVTILKSFNRLLIKTMIS